MKTKIIYISGNEVFDMADIRAAFDEVRKALNLDKDTVMFGVPVDADDAGLSVGSTIQDEAQEFDTVANIDDVAVDAEITPIAEPTVPAETIVAEEVIADSPVEEKPVKKRGRSRKVKDEDTPTEPVATPESVVETNEVTVEPADEKIVPILSILSGKDEPEIVDTVSENIIVDDENEPQNIEEKIPEIVSETVIEKVETQSDDLNSEEIEQISEKIETDEPDTDIEPDLEQLLSAMKPLQEDILEAQHASETADNSEPDENIDATLEQLATEFVQTQDKIASETKSSTRSKIGKLRNILPFKQSKHKDQGLGDLFGWAGVAANDEEFSVPGFFTNASSRK